MYYASQIEQGIIPDWAPHGTSPRGFDYSIEHSLETYKARDVCTRRGLWTVIDRNWTGVLADWIGDRKVLEIMAGAGHLAKALSERGIEVVATDNFSFKKRHLNLVAMYDILPMEAVAAAGKLTADVLIVSWPPYGEMAVVDAVRAWGPERPIVYIGESDGGCNAPEQFFAGFFEDEDDDAPHVPMMSWPGLHDQVMIGHWREPEGGDDDDDTDRGG